MTRPKVPEDKRQRTAHACDSCKRRKQKCNGHRPCNACNKRHSTCHYSPFKPPRGVCIVQKPPPVLKRNHVFKPVDMSKYASMAPKVSILDIPSRNMSARTPSWGPGEGETPVVPTTEDRGIESLSLATEKRKDSLRHGTQTNCGHEKVEARLLQGSMGRLYFIGESSTLAFLQTVRIIVESSDGSSPFTDDPLKHRILDIPLPRHISASQASELPERKKATLLAQNFFTYTYGMIEVLDAQSFWQCIDVCYKDSMAVSSSDICIVHLVLAIGSAMRRIPEASDGDGYKSSEAHGESQADKSFQAARSMLDDLSEPGQPDVWVVQALTLSVMYHLTMSRRNAAEECHGQAVRSALALGFHRSWDTSPVHNRREITLRRRIWSSLFILDRFIAASLGRPLAIQDEDHPISAKKLQQSGGPQRKTTQIKSGGVMEVSFRLGKILNEIMRGDDASKDGKVVDASLYDRLSDTDLDSPQIHRTAHDPAQAMALLHWRLMDDHATILQSRAFFLSLLLQAPQEMTEVVVKGVRSRPIRGAMTPCVRAAARSISLARDAYTAEILPGRNPFLMYYVFTATLIMLCSDFAGLQTPGSTGTYASQAMMVMHHWASVDRQAERYLTILASLEAVIVDIRHQKQHVTVTGSTRTTTRTSSVAGSLTSEHEARRRGSGDQTLDLSRLTSVSPLNAHPSIHNIPKDSNMGSARAWDQQVSHPDATQRHAGFTTGNLSTLSSATAPSMTTGGEGSSGPSEMVGYESHNTTYTGTYDFHAGHSQFGLHIANSAALGEAFDPALWDALPALAGNDLGWPFYNADAQY